MYHKTCSGSKKSVCDASQIAVVVRCQFLMYDTNAVVVKCQFLMYHKTLRSSIISPLMFHKTQLCLGNILSVFDLSQNMTLKSVVHL